MGARDERDGGRWYPSFSGTTRGRGDGRARPKRRAPGGATVGRRVAPLSCSQSSQRRRSESKSRIRGEYLERAAARQEERKSGEALDTARKLHARTQHRHSDPDGARRTRTRRENGEINETGRSRRELVIGRETERDRRRVRQRVNELFFRRLLALFYSGLIPRERRRSAHRRSIDATIATTIVARAHLRASLSRRPGSPRRPRCRCSGGWTPGKMR